MMIMRTTMMKTMTVNITEPVEIVTTRMFIDNYNENNDEFSVCVNLAIFFVHVNLTIFFNFEFI